MSSQKLITSLALGLLLASSMRKKKRKINVPLQLENVPLQLENVPIDEESRTEPTENIKTSERKVKEIVNFSNNRIERQVTVACLERITNDDLQKIETWILSLECLYAFIEKIHINLPKKYMNSIDYDEDAIVSLQERFPLMVDVNRSMADYGLVHGFLNSLIKSSSQSFLFLTPSSLSAEYPDYKLKTILFTCLEKMEMYKDVDMVMFENFFLIRCLRLRSQSSKLFEFSILENKKETKTSVKEILLKVIHEIQGKVISLKSFESVKVN